MSKGMDIVYWVVGLLSTLGALWFFYRFLQSRGPEGDKSLLWYAIGLAVIACVCAVAYFLRHVNKDEEIHITQ